MKKVLLITTLALSLMACGRKSIDLPINSDINYGLNSPVTLEAGINQIFTQDYIVDINKVDSVTVDVKGLKATLSPDKSIIILDNIKMPRLANLAIWAEGIPYSVLIKKSDKLEYIFSYNPNGKRFSKVQLAGQMNDWVPEFHPELTLDADSNYSVALIMAPGTYLYQVVRDGEWNHDENNPDKVDNGSGKFNSILKVQGTQDKAPILLSNEFSADYFELKSLNNAEEYYIYWNNYKLPNAVFLKEKGNKIRVELPAEALNVKRSHMRVIAANKYGISNDILIPLEYGKVVSDIKEIDRFDKHGEVLYSLMVDRFYDADSTNNHPMNRPDVNPKVDYWGGDIKGITKKINDGYFNDMGFTTIWLSPVIQNPLTPNGQLDNPKTRFSGYHGYWPISSTKVDFRFGTEQELKDLTAAAHAKGLNVILDFVANHVHRDHPMFKADSTICTPLYLPDGRKNIAMWNEHRTTTWFDDFIPTLDYTRTEIVETMTDSAVWWLNNFNLDGFRHDACKHVPETFWRTLTKKVKTEVEMPRNEKVYQIGESYGSPALISSYVNSGMLDGQFDFNVSDDAANVFVTGAGGFGRISNTLNTSLRVYGSHNLMGYISGNHDRARFISYASGDVKYNEDSKAAGWQREIGLTDTTAYDKLIQLNAFNLTIPGVPVVYYGDEYGDPGANDPDCRRMARFDEQLTKSEKRVRDAVAKLGQLRKNNLALIYGDFIELKIEDKVWAYARNYFGETVIVVFNANAEAQDIKVGLPTYMKNIKFDSNFGSEFNINDEVLDINVKANGIEVLTIKK